MQAKKIVFYNSTDDEDSRSKTKDSYFLAIAKVSELGLDKASDICVLVTALTFTA